MEAVARLKNCPMSPRKMRLVVDNIRGKNIDEALDILRFTKNEAAEWLYKVLLSAVANWEYKLDGAESADEYDLYIKRAMVDGGAFLKRFRPAPHGRAARIKKRTNHVTLVVENRRPLDFELAGAGEPELSVEVDEVGGETAEKE
ncbi:MAG: 50S ribosomal protein L22 [Bacteroidetes bacterium]|nr:MAG: 50S ribosomal protein L22 [Bacteroidota bacterium]